MRAAFGELSLLLVLLISAACAVVTDAALAHARANPIRKVVNLLQKIEKKVRAEGDKKQALYDTSMCNCKSTIGSLTAALAESEALLPQTQADLNQANAQREQISADLEKTRSDRAEAQKTIREASALRERDAQAFEKESAEMKANVKAMGAAINAISKGASAAFLQTSSASDLRQLSLSMNMNSEDRDVLSAFLAGGGAQGYEPATGEVLGMLKAMAAQMAKDLDKSSKDEMEERGNHESLVAAKKREISAASKGIEDKLARMGKLGVEISQLGNMAEAGQRSIEEDKAFLAEQQKACEQMQADWQKYQKLQSEELVAIADTIKLLNEDDALDIFKKTLPSAGLAQTDESFSFLQHRSVHHEARRLSRSAHGRRHGKDARLALVEMMLKGQTGGVKQVTSMIESLLTELDNEQTQDDSEKDFCVSEISHAEAEHKDYKRDVGDAETVIADASDSVEFIRKEIERIMNGIQKLDDEVKKATALRKAQHEGIRDAAAEAGVARQVLEVAKQRLAKFYQSASEDGSDAGDQEAALDQQGSEDGDDELDGQDADAGEGPDLTYKKKHEAAGSAVQMIETLRDDLSKQIQDAKKEDEFAQREYEEYLELSKERRAWDVKAVANKGGVKAELEAALQRDMADKKSSTQKLLQTSEELKNLHINCDWLLQNYEVRRQARADERDSLHQAQAVLEQHSD
jgi:chromosome segregation ATPase